MQKLKSLVISILVIGLFSGCATTKLQTNTKVTKSIILDHSIKDNKNIYLQVTNTANGGGEDMQLFRQIKWNLEDKGYNIVPRSKDAGYGIFVNILFANNLKEANAIGAGMNAGMLGAMATSSSGGSGRDSLIVGTLMAIGGGYLGKSMEDETFRAVVNVQIRDYKDEMITTHKTTSQGTAKIRNKARAGNLNQFASSLRSKNSTADLEDDTKETISSTQIKDYEEYNTKIFVEATQNDLKLDDALPILERKISRQIANLF